MTMQSSNARLMTEPAGATAPGCRGATAVVTMPPSHPPLINGVYAGWAGLDASGRVHGGGER